MKLAPDTWRRPAHNGAQAFALGNARSFGIVAPTGVYTLAVPASAHVANRNPGPLANCDSAIGHRALLDCLDSAAGSRVPLDFGYTGVAPVASSAIVALALSLAACGAAADSQRLIVDHGVRPVSDAAYGERVFVRVQGAYRASLLDAMIAANGAVIESICFGQWQSSRCISAGSVQIQGIAFRHSGFYPNTLYRGRPHPRLMFARSRIF